MQPKMNKLLDAAATWYQRSVNKALRKYGLQYEDVIMCVCGSRAATRVRCD